jgi:hypothetical protein
MAPLQPNIGNGTANTPTALQSTPLEVSLFPPLTPNYHSSQKLDNLEKAATRALDTGDYQEIMDSNPQLGKLLEALRNSDLSLTNQKAVLAMVFDDARQMSEDPFSPSSIMKLPDQNILSGLNPNNIPETDALKDAALIAAAIVAESAQNAKEEQQRMQDIQSRIGEIPGSVKATVVAKYNVAHMTNGEIIAAIEREMQAQNRDNYGKKKDIT